SLHAGYSSMTRGWEAVNPGARLYACCFGLYALYFMLCTLCLGHVVDMLRAGIGHHGWAEVGKLDLEAFDLEPQCCPAREGQHDCPARRAHLGELDRQKVEELVLPGGVYVLALAGEHPLEPQCRATAAQLRCCCHRGGPIEPIDRQHKPPLGGTPVHVRNPDLRILKMGGDDLQIFLVEGDELHRVHGGLFFADCHMTQELGSLMRTCKAKALHISPLVPANAGTQGPSLGSLLVALGRHFRDVEQ